MLDFFVEIDNRRRPIADIEHGHIPTASCILASAAMGLGRPLAYDLTKREIVGDAHATKLLTRAYRAPWLGSRPLR